MQQTIIRVLAGLLAFGLASGAEAQGLRPPPGAPFYMAGPPGAPPIIMPQAPMDPHQFCYFNGQPYSMGALYPGNTPGPNGRQMRCRASDAAINGYLMMEWSDEN